MTQRGVAAVYRSLDPTVLAGYHDWQTRVATWTDELRAEIDRHFPDHGILRNWGPHGMTFAGIHWTRDDGPIPDGWRVIGGRGATGIMPKRNTNKGKAIAKRFAAIGGCADPALPGMITEWWGEPSGTGFGFRIFYPSIHVLDDTLYVVWAVVIDHTDAMGNDTGKIIPGLWEPVPLSVYHAAVEAAETAAAT